MDNKSNSRNEISKINFFAESPYSNKVVNSREYKTAHIINKCMHVMRPYLKSVDMFRYVLITYPNLGHGFYPSSQWLTSFGPVPPYVLADLYTWLEAHSGFTTPASSSTIIPSSNTTGHR